MIDEEQQFNQLDSSFKRDLQRIFDDCSQKSPSARRTGSSTSKRAKAARDWLLYILKNHLPTIPLWSNLLLGTFLQL